jgi:putative phosphoesterase
MSENQDLRVGLVSDTHGLLRPEVRAFLMGCDYIIHGGDIGGAQIVKDLGAIAPLIVVRGNNDAEPWAARIRETELMRAGNIFIYVIHNSKEIDVDPRILGARVVVSGHTHKPLIDERDGVLFVNPGSCGPRRFKLPISFGDMSVTNTSVDVRLVDLTGDVYAAASAIL